MANDPYTRHLFDKVPGEWWDHGACKGHDPDLWFPEKHTSPARTRIARDICNACEVRQACLDFALAEPPEVHGIWGGFTQRELKKLRVQNRRNRKTNSKGDQQR